MENALYFGLSFSYTLHHPNRCIMKNTIKVMHRSFFFWLLFPSCVLLFEASCRGNSEMEKEDCPDTPSFSSLSGVWSTSPQPNDLLGQYFLHHNTLVTSNLKTNATVITALHEQSGEFAWQKSLPFIPLNYMRKDGDRLFYCSETDNICSYLDLNTQTEHQVFQAGPSQHLSPLCATMGDLLANTVYEVNTAQDSVTVRIYVSDLRTASSKQVDKMRYGLAVLSSHLPIPLMEFTTTAAGDTLLCFMQYLYNGLTSGAQLQYQSLQLRTGKKSSGPAFSNPYYNVPQGYMTFHEGRVYYSTLQGIACLNAQSAQPEWKADVSDYESLFSLHYAKERLLVFRQTEYYALDPVNGKVLWKWHIGNLSSLLGNTVLAIEDDYTLLAAFNEIIKI